MMLDEKPKSGKGTARGVIFKVVGMLFGLSLILSYQFFVRSKIPQKPKLKAESGIVAIADAIAEKKSGLIVQGFAAVKSVLPDDADNGKHQNFIVSLENGRTFSVSHDVDVAPRVPLKQADLIEFRGQYDWNDQGGIVHWTHHDPDMNHQDGWIKLNGKVYR